MTPTPEMLKAIAEAIVGDCYRCERQHPCGHDDVGDTSAAERVWRLISQPLVRALERIEELYCEDCAAYDIAERALRSVRANERD